MIGFAAPKPSIARRTIAVEGGHARRQPVDETVVGEVAGRGDDDVARPVVGRVVRGDVVARHRLDARVGAEHRSTERVAGKQRTGEHVVHEVVGRVVTHPDLLEDHLPFRIDLVGPERRPPQHVAQDLDREVEVRVGHADVEDGLFLAGERVHLAADRLDRLRDLTRRTVGVSP